MYNTIPQTKEEKDLWFRAEMNRRQLLSIAHRLMNSDIENETLNNNYFLRRVRKASNYNGAEVEQWLKNSWNSECVLGQNEQIIANTGQSFCIQWAFPQAYYSVFGNLLGLYSSIGFTEKSHSAVLKKYATILKEGKKPESVSMCCDGPDHNLEYINIDDPIPTNTPMDLDLNNAETINYHICTFLRSTRRMRLKEKAPKLNLKTASGDKRKNYSRDNWVQISESLGPTSVVDYLYRKRIKGNYQDIEVYNCPYFKGEDVLESLVQVVDRINLSNEIYIAKAIGLEEYNQFVDNHLGKIVNLKLTERKEITNNIIKAII